MRAGNLETWGCESWLPQLTMYSDVYAACDHPARVDGRPNAPPTTIGIRASASPSAMTDVFSFTVTPAANSLTSAARWT